jgi:hypothetical protein
LHTWFMTNSAWTVFKDSPIPNDVQALLPTIIQDHKNNYCAEEIDPSLAHLGMHRISFHPPMKNHQYSRH